MNNHAQRTGPRRLWFTVPLSVAVIYMIAYYATYTPFRGPKSGLVDWEPYMIGAWAIPHKIAVPLFAPADWIDEKLRPDEHEHE